MFIPPMRTLNARAVSALLFAALLLASCGSDGSGKTANPSEASAGDGALQASGTVTRSVPISKMGDGKGTVHISIAKDCRNEQGTAVKSLASFGISAVDLTKKDAAAPFLITGLKANETYYAAAWFDDVDNEEQDEELPATGDLAMFGDLSPRCQKIELSNGDVQGVKLVLDYEMMFTLPGVDGEHGVMMTDDSVDPDDIVDDGSTHRVTIRLRRSVEVGAKGDAKGKFYSGLSESCFNDTTGQTPVPVVALVLDEVSLPKINTPIDLVIEDVPNGIYQFNGFIDDVDNADDKNPRPGIGDLVSFGGFGPACKKVVVNGKDVQADFDLNLLMPFDL